MKPSIKCVRSEAGSSSRFLVVSDCQNPLHVEATVNALYIYPALSKNNDLVHFGFTRKIKTSHDVIAFFPLLPPLEVAEHIYSSCKIPGAAELQRTAYSWPPAEFTLSPSGAIECIGSVTGRSRFLRCVSRQHAADSLFKVTTRHRALDPDLHGSAFIFPLGSGSRR